MEHAHMTQVHPFPVVLLDDGSAAYGGSQNWYSEFWNRKAGCAAVCASDLAAFHHLGIEPASDNTISQARFLTLMDEMFCYMRPGMRGFPHADKFLTQFLSYAQAHGAEFCGEVIENWASAEDAFRCVRRSIADNLPLALLILGHNAPEIDENTWHWMCVTGFDPDSREILISNYSRREWMQADIVFDPSEGNEVRLVLLRPVQS